MGDIWTMKEAAAQVSLLNAECEAGPLAKSVAWQWLLSTIKNGPDLHIGQPVWLELHAEVHGVKLSQWAKFYVLSIHRTSSSEAVEFKYDLTSDLPEPYHYGKGPEIKGVSFAELKLKDPAA